MAFRSHCFTVTPSAGSPPYTLDFSQVELIAEAPQGFIIDIAAYLSGAGAPPPYTNTYGAGNTATSDSADGQIVSGVTGPVTMTLDANLQAFAGHTGRVCFAGSVSVTDAAGCMQVINIPDGYCCAFDAQLINAAPNCPDPMAIACTGGDIINYTSPVFTDDDGDPVSLTFAGVPSWLTLLDNGNGTFDADGTSPTGAGTYTITITASDGTDDCSTSLTITCVSAVNSPPTCPPNVTVDCATDLPYTSVNFVDPDGDPLTFTDSGLPTGYTLTYGANNYTLDGSGGSGIVTITANDGNGGTCAQTLTINGCSTGISGVGTCGADTGPGQLHEPRVWCGFGNAPSVPGTLGTSLSGTLCGTLSITNIVSTIDTGTNGGPETRITFDAPPDTFGLTEVIVEGISFDLSAFPAGTTTFIFATGVDLDGAFTITGDC